MCGTPNPATCSSGGFSGSEIGASWSTPTIGAVFFDRPNTRSRTIADGSSPALSRSRFGDLLAGQAASASRAPGLGGDTSDRSNVTAVKTRKTQKAKRSPVTIDQRILPAVNAQIKRARNNPARKSVNNMSSDLEDFLGGRPGVRVLLLTRLDVAGFAGDGDFGLYGLAAPMRLYVPHDWQ